MGRVHWLQEMLTRRLVPVLEKARTENEPAWHLALRFSEFLYHGETAALEALIRHLRDRPDPAGWRGELLRRWTRQADKLPAPAGEAALRDFARSSSAADFLRDPEQRLWMRQPQAPAP